MKHLVFYSSFIAFIASTIIYIMTLVKFIGDSSMNEIMFLISLIISIIALIIILTVSIVAIVFVAQNKDEEDEKTLAYTELIKEINY